jgi:hypothetical protein
MLQNLKLIETEVAGKARYWPEAEWSGFDSQLKQKFLPSQQHPTNLYGPPKPRPSPVSDKQSPIL